MQFVDYVQKSTKDMHCRCPWRGSVQPRRMAISFSLGRAMVWEPPPHEADKFCNVYIDESSQTKHRYLVIGGLVVPYPFAIKFEQDIIAARSDAIPTHDAEGKPRVMKWQKVGNYNLETYKRVFDAAFNFPTTHNMPARYGHLGVALHCVIVDTSIKPLAKSGDGDVEVGFDKEFHFLCTLTLLQFWRDNFFALYPDRRQSKRDLKDAREIMCRTIYKYGDRRRGVIRHLEFDDPESCQALQVADILIGAIAYKVNGHYDAPKANQAKKALCDYIWARAKLRKPEDTTPRPERRRITWIFRPKKSDLSRSGPQNYGDPRE